MRKILCFALILSNSVFAGTLTVTEFEGDKNDQIPRAAKLNDIPLKRVGSGIREKKILFLGFNVYRATLLASDDSFSRDTKGTVALDSTQNMKAVAIQLKLMRSLSAKDIVKSFETALIENGVKDSPALVQFKDAIRNGGDVNEGDLVSIAFDKNRGVLICEQGKNVTEIKGDEKFSRDIFSIWLGKTADVGLTTLREHLILGT